MGVRPKNLSPPIELKEVLVRGHVLEGNDAFQKRKTIYQ